MRENLVYSRCIHLLFKIFYCTQLKMAALNFPNVSDLNQRELYHATDDPASAILWASQHGLLATQMVCPNFPRQMWENKDAKRQDGIRWT